MLAIMSYHVQEVMNQDKKEVYISEEGKLKKERLRERNMLKHSEWMKQKWETPTEAMLDAIKHFKEPKTQEHKTKIKESKLTDIEYKGKIYRGWDALLKTTGVTKHLYKKYYLNGYDPEVNVGVKHNPKLVSL